MTSPDIFGEQGQGQVLVENSETTKTETKTEAKKNAENVWYQDWTDQTRFTDSKHHQTHQRYEMLSSPALSYELYISERSKVTFILEIAILRNTQGSVVRATRSQSPPSFSTMCSHTPPRGCILFMSRSVVLFIILTYFSHNISMMNSHRV